MSVTSAEWAACMQGLALTNQRRDQQLEAILQELRAIRNQLVETANRQAQKEADTAEAIRQMAQIQTS